jgi:hypothetical protein
VDRQGVVVGGDDGDGLPAVGGHRHAPRRRRLLRAWSAVDGDSGTLLSSRRRATCRASRERDRRIVSLVAMCVLIDQNLITVDKVWLLSKPKILKNDQNVLC